MLQRAGIPLRECSYARSLSERLTERLWQPLKNSKQRCEEVDCSVYGKDNQYTHARAHNQHTHAHRLAGTNTSLLAWMCTINVSCYCHTNQLQCPCSYTPPPPRYRYVCTYRLQKMEVSQMKLSHCLALSDQSYEHAAQVFKAHTRRLVSMKQDVESIHKRIRLALGHCCMASSYSDHQQAVWVCVLGVV